jgi:nitrile hydratase subunit beta
MNGAQDLGGQMGFGPVIPEKNEPLFHGDWEKRALALTLCAGGMGHWSIDESRHARETLHPVDYLASSYYELWIKGLEKLLTRHGFVTSEELKAGTALTPPATPSASMIF